MSAPFTGIPKGGTPAVGTVSSLRYLVPTLVVALACLALAARAGRLARGYALAALTVALAASASQTFRLGFPRFPHLDVVAAGAAAGSVVALVLASVADRRIRLLPPRLVAPAGALAAVACGAVLAAAGPGFVTRHARAFAHASRRGPAKPGAVDWLAAQASFRHKSRPVAFSLVTYGMLAGDRLQHPLALIGQRETCARIRERLRLGWIVEQPVMSGSPLHRCLATERPAYADAAVRVYTGPAAR
jgi:hypothetical protein